MTFPPPPPGDRWDPPSYPSEPPPPAPSGPPRMGLGDIFDRTFEIYRQSPGVFMKITLASAIPLAFLSILYALNVNPSSDPNGKVLAGFLVVLVGSLLLGQFSNIGSGVATVDALHGRTPDATRSLTAVTDRLGIVFAVAILTALGVAAGLVAFVIPGIIIGVRWLFASLVSVTEQRGIGDAFRRSTQLVNGTFWATLGISLVIGLVFGLAQGLAQTAVSAIVDAGLSGTQAIVVSNLLAIIPMVLIAPLGYIGIALLYAERCRTTDGAWPKPLPD